ncbi:MAG: hypothetical protein SFX73_38580 [Kofleriaceae bacterium]|nr:hypothetical protein [Kofleriaceae bacterium]
MPKTKPHRRAAATARIRAAYDAADPDGKQLILVIVEAAATVSPSNIYEIASVALGDVAYRLPWLFDDAERRCRLMLDAMEAQS